MDKSKFNILYLMNHNTYINKMSRCRIHYIQAIGKLSNLYWSGIDWPKYNNNISVQDNINNIFPDIIFDAVIAYKPLEMKNFCDVQCIKIIKYNEMYDFNETLKEIEQSMANIVICHHENDMKTYEAYYNNYHGQKNKNVKFVNLKHCSNDKIFKELHIQKEYDILVIGRLNCKNTLFENHYPLRDRMSKLIKSPKLKNYKCGIFIHPKSNNSDSHTDKYLIEFANAINKAKICISCSGLPNTRFSKYVEVPMCGSVHCADIPNDESDEFKKFVIEINLNMTDDQIIEKLKYYLENKEKLEEFKNYGLSWSKQYTTDKYAERFINMLEHTLNIVDTDYDNSDCMHDF